MQVILLEDVPKLGDMGEIVNVKPGFARNYLLPQKLALQASSGNVAQLTHQRQMIDSRKEKMRAEAEQLQKGLDGVSVTIAKKAGDNTDRLFGSVTNRDIASALESAGHKVDSKKILLENPIKELGIFGVPVKLHTNITASVKVWIVNA